MTNKKIVELVMEYLDAHEALLEAKYNKVNYPTKIHKIRYSDALGTIVELQQEIQDRLPEGVSFEDILSNVGGKISQLIGQPPKNTKKTRH